MYAYLAAFEAQGLSTDQCEGRCRPGPRGGMTSSSAVVDVGPVLSSVGSISLLDRGARAEAIGTSRSRSRIGIAERALARQQHRLGDRRLGE
jgi:hypothetical protein